MRFGKSFLGFKALSLAIRSLVFLGVLALTEKSFGANYLMSFLSWVTVAGIALGFGASDSLVVSSDEQFARISRSVFLASLVGFGIISLLFVGMYWINVAITCFNYGLSFWNLGLIRRRNPFLFEQISNYQTLLIWSIYFLLLPLETSDLRVLSALYSLVNGALAIIALKISHTNMNSAPAAHLHSLELVSVNKLGWEINYSALTRMPFLLPAVSTSIHASFSYCYLLFEMSSAMLSHYQTVFLKSQEAKIRAWTLLSSALLAINATSLVALLTVIQFQHIVIHQIADILGIQLQGIAQPLMYSDIAGLVVFMLAITTLQATAFGRYAIKLEANVRIPVTASAVTVLAFAITWVFVMNFNNSLYFPLIIMFISALLLLWVICRSASDGYHSTMK